MAFAADRADGSWRTRSYEVRREGPPRSNANWFRMTEFRAAVASPLDLLRAESPSSANAGSTAIIRVRSERRAEPRSPWSS